PSACKWRSASSTSRSVSSLSLSQRRNTSAAAPARSGGSPTAANDSAASRISGPQRQARAATPGSRFHRPNAPPSPAATCRRAPPPRPPRADGPRAGGAPGGAGGAVFVVGAVGHLQRAGTADPRPQAKTPQGGGPGEQLGPRRPGLARTGQVQPRPPIRAG